MIGPETAVLRIYDCIAGQHDFRLVALAVVVCLLGCGTAVVLLRHVRGATGTRRQVWLAATALATGFAIWATHFIAMLAFDPGVGAGYRIPLTALSLVAAVAITGLGFHVTLRTSRRGPFLGGACVGLGIAAMHYLGMAAFDVAGAIAWRADLVVASVLIGVAFGVAGLKVAAGGGLWRQALGAACLTVAICGHHVTAMRAATIIPDPTVAVPPTAVPPAVLAAAVAVACILASGLSLVGLAAELRARRRVWAEAERMRGFADAAIEGLAICEGDRVVTINRSLRALLGLDDAAPVVARLSELVTALPNEESSAGLESELVTAAGASIPVELVARPVVYAGAPHRLIAFRDLRARRDAEAEIRFLARHDPSTGLPNRISFDDRLGQEIERLQERGGTLAVFAVGLEGSKEVNDALGHVLGDALLRKVADRLRSTVGEGDVVARLGDGEFAVLRREVEAPAAAAAAGRLNDLLSRPFLVHGEVVALSANVGIAMAPLDGREPVELVKRADLALSGARRDGRGDYRFFAPGMDEEMRGRRLFERDLRQAAAREEFQLHFQPQLDLASNRIDGVEALLRWEHAERGSVSPAEFIPLAEETGLIAPIGEWVLHTACAAAARWPAPVSVAVNLSAIQFKSPDLIASVGAALARSGLDPRRLELEITESVLLQDGADTLAVLHRLRDLGVRIAMDDFGTGYSSLGYLHRFPFDKIKIDRSFVAALGTDHGSLAIIQAVVALSRGLGITMTAEGVETPAQLAKIRAEGCDQVQGFLVSRPVRAESLTAIFENTSLAPA